MMTTEAQPVVRHPDGGYRCLVEWHYGTVAPLLHADGDGRTGWIGYHGASTPNADHVCDECRAEWFDNYGYAPAPDVARAMEVLS